MAKYKVTLMMVFPDDIHAEDIKNIAEQRLGREIHSIGKPNERIVIDMDGGLIQDIHNIPAGIEIEVRDFDIEGADESDLVKVEGGIRNQAFVSIWTHEEVRKVKQ